MQLRDGKKFKKITCFLLEEKSMSLLDALFNNVIMNLLTIKPKTKEEEKEANAELE